MCSRFLTFFLTINQTDGMGCKTVKFHNLTHLADDISRLGSPQNCSTQCFESNHPEMSKNSAKQTQIQVSVFLPQLGKNYGKSVIIERAYDEVQPKVPDTTFDDQWTYEGKCFF